MFLTNRCFAGPDHERTLPMAPAKKWHPLPDPRLYAQ
jgi:hypothetical protein